MKSPAFQFYPTDWLGSQRVQMLTLEEEGAYIRLVASCWQHGSIPADTEQCARIIGKGCSTTVARVVQAMFQPSHETGRLVHDRLESERIKQADWREKSSLGGKKSAQMRAISRVVQPPCKRDATNHLATLPLSPSILLSPSPSPVSNGEYVVASLPRTQKPTIEAIKLQAAKIGLAETEAEKFFDFYESNGWRVGKNPMKSWSAALSNWKRNAANFTHANGLTPQAQPVQTVFGLTKIIEAKQREADGLKSRWAVETGLDTTWSSTAAREDFVALRVQIKKLNQQLAGMA